MSNCVLHKFGDRRETQPRHDSCLVVFSCTYRQAEDLGDFTCGMAFGKSCKTSRCRGVNESVSVVDERPDDNLFKETEIARLR